MVEIKGEFFSVYFDFQFGALDISLQKNIINLWDLLQWDIIFLNKGCYWNCILSRQLFD